MLELKNYGEVEWCAKSKQWVMKTVTTNKFVSDVAALVSDGAIIKVIATELSDNKPLKNVRATMIENYILIDMQ